MKAFVVCLTLILAAVLPLTAAQGTPAQGAPQVYVASHLTWSEAGPDLATVQGYTYAYTADGAQTATTLTGVTCSGTASPFPCSVAVPAFTPGAHSLTLTASDVAGVSPASAAISFTFVVAPQAPTNLAIK